MQLARWKLRPALRLSVIAATGFVLLAGCGAPSSGPSPSERDGFVRCKENPGSFYKPPNDWTCRND